VIIEFDALGELDLDDVPLLVPDGCPPVLRDVPLAAANHLENMYVTVYRRCAIKKNTPNLVINSYVRYFIVKIFENQFT
jgi:hypothetical protein